MYRNNKTEVNIDPTTTGQSILSRANESVTNKDEVLPEVSLSEHSNLSLQLLFETGKERSIPSGKASNQKQ